MKHKRLLFIAILSLFSLVGCFPSEQEILAALTQTQAARLTNEYTYEPSPIPTQTNTPSPTRTTTPTNTQTNTPAITKTPTKTSTRTPTKAPTAIPANTIPTSSPTPSCALEGQITFINSTGGWITINLTGPAKFSFSMPGGTQTFQVCTGFYSYTVYGCGGESLNGSISSGEEIEFYCE